MMDDSEMAQIVPEWANWSKKKRDKIWKEYFNDSISGSPEFKMLEARCDVFDRERFLDLLPVRLMEQNMPRLLESMESNWNNVFEKGNESECLSLALDAWDRAGPAIIHSLDSRNSMFVVTLIGILNPIVQRVGRAVSSIRKSPKFAPFCTYVIGAHEMLSAVPFQHEFYNTLAHMLFKVSQSFFDRLMEAGVLEAINDKLANTCPSILSQMGLTLQLLVRAADRNYPDTTNLDPSIKAQFERTAKIAGNRLLATDVTKERFPNCMNAAGYTDVGGVVGPLAQLLQNLAICFKIPVPLEVRKHLKPFGAKYTEREPTDPLERSRWSDRYIAMRVAELDWASPKAEKYIKDLKRAEDAKYYLMDRERSTNVQCAGCRKLEDADEGLLSKCAKCKRVYYCCRECQVGHWPVHKKTCRKPARASLPQPFLTLEESIQQGRAKATSGGDTSYPTLFAIWLDWKYNTTDSSA